MDIRRRFLPVDAQNMDMSRVILYTSSSGSVITPYSNSVGTIISNTCVNGEGVILCRNPITKIGNRAFKNCTDLTSIIIPEGVTTIGSEAFVGCTNVTKIVLPSSITTFESSTSFRNCSGEIIVNCNLIPPQTSSSGVFVDAKFSKAIIGDDVLIIGDRAFYDCKSLTSVTIGNSVTSIGGMAFYNCTSLTSITIPDSVTEIGGGAFYYCTNLTTVRLSSSLTELNNQIFYNCTNLHTITIPDSVTAIGRWAFYSCTNINLVIPKSVVVLDQSVYGCGGSLTVLCTMSDSGSDFTGAFARNNFRTITVGDPNDASPIYIAKYAFYTNTQLQQLTLHKNVVAIGESAFEDCSSLANITIPESVTEIGESAFEGSDVLNNVTIKGNKVNVGESAFCTDNSKTYTLNLQGSLGRVEAYAFRYCSMINISNIGDWCSIVFTSVNSNPLTSAKLCVDGVIISDLIIPNNVSIINDLVFSNCHQLETVIIPDSVTEIKNAAFYRCSKLTSVEIGTFVTKIGDEAFDSCTALKYLPLPNSIIEIGNRAFNSCQKWENINIPSNITSIGDSAFSSCYGLTTVTLPNTLVTLGESVFSDCRNITAFYGKFASVNHWYLLYNNTVIAAAPKATSTFIIPQGITSIGAGAFNRCSDMTSVTIPDSVTSIGARAFYYCGKMTSITIPNSVTEIGEYAFYGCSSLTSIIVPNNITQISKSVWSNCRNLTTITIGESVTYIDTGAFSGSQNSTTVYCKAIVPPSMYRPSNSVYDPFSFAGISTGVIYVPRESLDTYKTHTHWSFYADYIQPYDF